MKLRFESVTLLATIFLASTAWCADNDLPTSAPDARLATASADCIQDPHATGDEKEDDKMIASIVFTLNKLLEDNTPAPRKKPLNYARRIRGSRTSDTFPTAKTSEPIWPAPLSIPPQKERKQ